MNWNKMFDDCKLIKEEKNTGEFFADLDKIQLQTWRNIMTKNNHTFCKMWKQEYMKQAYMLSRERYTHGKGDNALKLGKRIYAKIRNDYRKNGYTK